MDCKPVESTNIRIASISPISSSSLPVQSPIRKRGRPRKNKFVSRTTSTTLHPVAQATSCINSSIKPSMGNSVDCFERNYTMSSSIDSYVVSSTKQPTKKAHHCLSSPSTPKSQFEDKIPVTIAPNTSRRRNSKHGTNECSSQVLQGLTAPTKRSRHGHTTPLSSSPPRNYDQGENELCIFVDPDPQPQRSVSPAPKNVLDEISMPPPQHPQTPKIGHVHNSATSPFTQPRSHVDPSMLLHNAAGGFNMSSVFYLSSSPPKSSTSNFCSSPSTPKTFSTIIHSSPLYPGFRSSPVHGSSPSATPQLLPFPGCPRFPLPASNASRPILSKAFDGFPKLDFESLAREGLKKRRISGKQGSDHGLRHNRFVKSKPGKSLYHRRRDFLLRRRKNINTSSPTLPSSPKFGDVSNFSSRQLDLSFRQNMFNKQPSSFLGSGDEAIDVLATPGRQRSLSILSSSSMDSPITSYTRYSPFLPPHRSRQISLNISESGRAVITQEVPKFEPPKPIPVFNSPSTRVLDDRYESSEEEDDEDEMYESESELEFTSHHRSSDTCSATASPPSQVASSLIPLSLESSIECHESEARSQGHTTSDSPSSTSSLSPCMDRHGNPRATSPMSSPMHSPTSQPSPQIRPKKPLSIETQCLDQIFPELQSPFLAKSTNRKNEEQQKKVPSNDTKSEIETEINPVSISRDCSRALPIFRPIDAREAFCKVILKSKYISEEEKQKAAMLLTPSRGITLNMPFSTGFGLNAPSSPGDVFFKRSSRGHQKQAEGFGGARTMPNFNFASLTPTFEDFMFESYEDWAKSPTRF